MMPHDSRVLYAMLIAGIAFVRLGELRLSVRNARRLRAQGGVEAGARHYPAMVAVHAGALLAAPIEVFFADRTFSWALGAPMLALLAATMALRYWAISALGERWCTRVIVIPGRPLVASGPYRFLRHPNYLAVALEIPALALVHSAWLTAAVFGILNGLVLMVRIRREDAALGRHAGDVPVALAARGPR